MRRAVRLHARASTILPIAIALGGCSIEEPSEREVASPVTEYQGTDYQGTDYQGTDYQGTDYQGTDYQGTDYQGTDYQGGAYAHVAISGTSIVTWKQLADGTWEQRLPAKLCHWNATRRALVSPCTTYDLAVSPSPLAGATWPAQFTKVVSGQTVTITGTIRIGSDPSDVGAVSVDPSLAMHPLDGTAAASCDAQPEPCSNPRGCRRNCDLYTYELWLVPDASAPIPFCPGGAGAYALSGTWDAAGTYAAGSGRFTFACSNGTIAKCVRWGYRSFGSATKSDGTTVATAEYHQACVRAATADYCSSGRSFTRNGTLIDIYDYGGGEADVASTGFIPRTSTGTIHNTALRWESTFDKYGAAWVDHTRYAETSGPSGSEGIEDPTIGCPARWWDDGSGDVGANYNRLPAFGEIQNIRIGVSNTTSCAHSEQTVGKFLHHRCNFACTYAVSQLHPHCSDARDPRGWDQTCVDAAASVCKPAAGKPPMAIHSECTVGGALTKWDTGCTLKVCSQDPACCTGYGGWTSSCVKRASSICTGGREGESRFSGFCGGLLSPGGSVGG